MLTTKRLKIRIVARQGYPGLRTSQPNLKSKIRNPKSGGLTLFEVVASTMIVGMMAVAALNALGAASKSANSIGNRAVALGLADELLSDVVRTAYGDPNQTPVFGRESGEAATPRSGFDDVDDFDGWNQSPPQYRDGTVIPDRTNWREGVQVAYVQPANPTQATPSNADQGVKRIKVTIECNGKVLAEQYAIRTNSD